MCCGRRVREDREEVRAARVHAGGYLGINNGQPPGPPQALKLLDSRWADAAPEEGTGYRPALVAEVAVYVLH